MILVVVDYKLHSCCLEKSLSFSIDNRMLGDQEGLSFLIDGEGGFAVLCHIAMKMS